MTAFTTRVELIDSDETDDYDLLHDEMKKEGFTRTISAEGKKYHLPPAEYNFVGDKTRGEVMTKAKTAANKTQLKYRVLVTESNGRTWHNLDTN